MWLSSKGSNPVVAANGQQLNILGQVELPLHIGSIHASTVTAR